MNITKLLSDADAIQEKTTAQLKATLMNENNQAIPGSTLVTLTLTLYSISDTGFPLVAAARNAQNVLNNGNGVSVDGAGELTWDMATTDTVILNSALTAEIHRAVFEWTYLVGAVAKTGRHAIDHKITNMEKIT